jgi:hypothetical protein
VAAFVKATVVIALGAAAAAPFASGDRVDMTLITHEVLVPLTALTAK